VETNAIHTTQSSVVDFKDITAEQQTDSELTQLRQASLKLEPIPIPCTDSTILCDMTTGVPRPYIPLKFWRHVFDSLHSLEHGNTEVSHNTLAMYGQMLTKMFVCGHDLAVNARSQKFTITQLHHSAHSPLPMRDSTMFISILLDRSQFLKVTVTYSLVSTVSLDGQKLSPFQTWLLTLLHRHLSSFGSLVLEFHPQLLLIGGKNLS